MEEEKDEETIVVGDYVSYDKDHVMKTDAFYMTKQNQIKGYIQITKNYLQFNPI